MFFKSRPRFDALADRIIEIEDDFGADQEPTLNTPTATGPGLSEDDEELEEPPVDVSNYPKGSVSRAIDVAIDGYAASKREDVLLILSEILNRLEVLDGSDVMATALAQPDGQPECIRAALAEVLSWAEKHRDLIE